MFAIQHWLYAGGIAGLAFAPTASMAQPKPIDCASLPYTSSLSFANCSSEYVSTVYYKFDIYRGAFQDQNSAVLVALYKTRSGSFTATDPQKVILGTEVTAVGQQPIPWAYAGFLKAPPATSAIRGGKYLQFKAEVLALRGQTATCAQYFKFHSAQGHPDKQYYAGLFCMVGEVVPEAAVDLIVDSLQIK